MVGRGPMCLPRLSAKSLQEFMTLIWHSDHHKKTKNIVLSDPDINPPFGTSCVWRRFSTKEQHQNFFLTLGNQACFYIRM